MSFTWCGSSPHKKGCRQSRGINAFFTSVLNTSDGPWDSQSPELVDGDSGNNKLLANPKFVWNLLLCLDVYISTYIPGCTRSQGTQERCHCKTSLNYFLMVLGIWRDSSQLEAGKHCPSFQEGL